MPEFTWKLGRNPSPPDDRNLKLTKYLTIGKLPPTPQSVQYSPAVMKQGGYRMLLNDRYGCHDATTEVLTEKGWQPWPEYDGSPLGTMNQTTGLLEFQQPSALQRWDYDGPMYFADHRSLDFGLTPNHRMFHRPYVIPYQDGQYVPGTSGYGHYQFSPISELGTRVALPASTTGFLGAELRSLRIGGRDWDGDDFLAILALVLSDGYVSNAEHHRDTISFCCFREDRREMVAALACRLGISEFPKRRGVWQFTDGALAEWMKVNCYTNPTLKSPFKRVPDIVKVASVSQVQGFLKFYGDQHVSGEGSRSFSSTSRRMIDDLQELLLRIGKRGGIYSRPMRDGIIKGKIVTGATDHDDHTLTEWRMQGLVTLQRLSSKPTVQIDHYRGEVFCATVPNSTLVTRRNGQVLISGNCCVPAQMCHTVMQHAANAGHPMPVPSDAEVISLYSAIGGYVPGDPSTDNGCDMLTALNYWRNTGITIGGVVHKIGAFAQINLADPDEINAALWIFGSTFDGVNLPAAMQNSNFWGNIPSDLSGDWEPGSWGGHCVGQADATLDPNLDLYQTVTWGGLMATDATFMKAYCDEAYVVISQDWLADNGQCPAGFDIAALTDDLAAVSA